MTPQELFSTGQIGDQWIHGSDVGLDERDGLWVRSDAQLWPLPGLKVTSLGKRAPSTQFGEYSILTPDGVTALSPRDRSEPLWDYVQELRTGAIGRDWIAVR